MAILSVDNYVASTKQFLPFQKTTAALVTPNWYSTWLAGVIPAAGVAPGAANVPTDATQGAPLITNPTGGAVMCAGRLDVIATQPGQLILYDRLSHMSGLVGNVNTLQAVNTAAINRGDTSGVNVEGFVEWYSATGATPATATIVYTDDNSVSRTATQSWTATRPAQLVMPIPLIGAAAGIKSVQSLQLSVSTATAGVVGVTLARRLATVAIPAANTAVSLDPFSIGLPVVEADACLWVIWIPGSNATPTISGAITLATG